MNGRGSGSKCFMLREDIGDGQADTTLLKGPADAQMGALWEQFMSERVKSTAAMHGYTVVRRTTMLPREKFGDREPFVSTFLIRVDEVGQVGQWVTDEELPDDPRRGKPLPVAFWATMFTGWLLSKGFTLLPYEEFTIPTEGE